jgi:hypothetical protein
MAVVRSVEQIGNVVFEIVLVVVVTIRHLLANVVQPTDDVDTFVRITLWGILDVGKCGLELDHLLDRLDSKCSGAL